MFYIRICQSMCRITNAIRIKRHTYIRTCYKLSSTLGRTSSIRACSPVHRVATFRINPWHVGGAVWLTPAEKANYLSHFL